MARKAQKENRLKMFTFSQQINPEYWDWTPAEKETLSQGARAAGEVMLAKLEQAGLKPTDFYVILHDKDEVAGFDPLTMEGDGIKPLHFHGVGRYEVDPPNAQTLTNIAKALGIESQYVSPPKSGRYSYSNALAYLIHAKNPDKYQYPPEEVATLIGKDYMEHYAENFEAWERGAAQVKKKKAKGDDVAYYVQKVLMGELEINDMMLDDELYLMYYENKRDFDQAEATFGRRQAVKAEKALKRGEFHTRVFYVTGKPGAGKTHWVTTQLIPALINGAAEQGQKWRVYTAAATNPMDDWHGHEIVLLDDLRATSMTATDWLRLLDPYQAANLSARYENKMGVAPRVIIINAYSSPLEFFRYVRAAGDEAMDQFIRRLAMIWQVVKYDPNTGDGVITAQEIGKTHRHNWVRDAGKPYEKKIPMNHGAVTEWPGLTTDEATLLGLVSVALACSDIELMPQDVTQQQQVRAKGKQQGLAIEPGKLGNQLALELPESNSEPAKLGSEPNEPPVKLDRVDERGFYIPIPEMRFTDGS